MEVYVTLRRPALSVFVIVAVVWLAISLLTGGWIATAFGSALVLAWEYGRLARVTIDGGGFRPVRVVDILESQALDSLDAFDAEQASKKAEGRARRMGNQR